MFNFRFNFSVTLFVILTALWANYYFKHNHTLASNPNSSIEAPKEVILFDKSHPLTFHKLVATGQTSPDGNGEIFGQIKDSQGAILKKGDDKKSSPYICHNNAGPDHTSLLEKEGKLYSITQLECSIGGAYLSSLSQEPNGLLTLKGFEWIDFSAVGGTAVGCAGVTTAWQSHLGSEEYENDMATATLANPSIQGAHRYLGIQATADSIQQTGYSQGWITQIKLTDQNPKTQVTKHYALGRFSHELAYVMPDEKTLYLSDDATNGGFFMFIADEKRNFDAGTLYAAKWHQKKTKETLADLTWIALGHATHNQIAAYLQEKPNFYDLFDKKPYKQGCPSGYKAVNTSKTGAECLKVRPGKELLASRLESRRFAALMGATTEFNKAEGMTYNDQTNQLYLSISVLASGMEDGKKDGNGERRYDEGHANDIRLEYNPCGMILSFALTKQDLLGSDFVASSASKLIEGIPKFYPRPDQNQYNSCDITTIANPDNISMLANSPYLAIGEDSKGHEIDRLWLFNTQTKTLQEMAKAPLGAEFTSTYWHKDINGYSYLISVIQHPYGEKDWLIDHSKDAVDDKAKRSIIGYFGPFRF